MADDVTLNSMTGGSVVSTDQAGDGSHVQVIKLAYAADGSRTPIDADSDGLKVNVSNATVTVALGSALPSGSNVIGGVTQSGTWNIGSITTLPALPTGSNVIGAVTQSGTWNVGLSTGSNVIGAVTQSAGPWTVIERGSTIAHGTVSVATTSTQILSASATRRSAAITNTGNNTIWLGASGITTSSGLRLSPGATAIIDKSATAAIFGVAETATTSVAFFAESD